MHLFRNIMSTLRTFCLEPQAEHRVWTKGTGFKKRLPQASGLQEGQKTLLTQGILFSDCSASSSVKRHLDDTFNIFQYSVIFAMPKIFSPCKAAGLSGRSML